MPVEFDILGYPIFKGDDLKFTTNLDESLRVARDKEQFIACTKALKNEILAGNVPKEIFTQKQLNQIMNEKPYIDGLIWHHHQVPRKMQLVNKRIHKYVGHLGGNKLWGGNGQ